MTVAEFKAAVGVVLTLLILENGLGDLARVKQPGQGVKGS